MIRRSLWVFLVLVIATLAGQQLIKGSGYLLLVLPDGITSIEMSFWTGLVLLLLSWLLAAWLLALLGWLHHPLAGVKRLRQRYRVRRSIQLSVQGLLDLAEGRWRKARKKLVKGAKSSGAPMINYLAAAHAAHYEGEEETAEKLLHQAAATTPQATLAIDFSQARIQLDQGHLEQALATLIRLRRQVPAHPLVLRQLKEVYLALQDWRALLQLLPDLKKYKVCGGDELAVLEQQAYLNYFQQLARAESLPSLKEMKEVWEQVPARMKSEDALTEAYLALLLKIQAYADAEVLLQQRLNHHWSETLITAYGLLPAQVDPKKRLLEAERWLQARPNDAALLHALGRICQQQALWGKAQAYYEASHQLQADQALLLEMSQLQKALGDERKSQYYAQQAIQALGRQLPDLPLPTPQRR